MLAAGTKIHAFPETPVLVDRTGVVAIWFTEPPGLVMQFVQGAQGTVELAEWLVGPARAVLLKRFPDPSKLVSVMDLSLMEGRDRAVRPILTEATKQLRFARSFVVPPRNAGAVYLASLHASVSLMRVFGIQVEIDSLANALRVLGLRAS